MKIIIYATHDAGTYSQLVKNPDVVVLGFGTKWKGFIEKARVINTYLNTLDDNEIVVVLDGFDSVIKKTSGLEEIFKSMDCKVLYSHEDKSGFSKYLPLFLEKYIKSKIFGICKGGTTANAGMYMGYTGYLINVLSNLINGDSDDDQRNLNNMCQKFPFLKIDTNHIIFENCESYNQISNAYFCQVPGEVSVSRIKRALIEYPKFLIPEITLIIIIMVLVYYGIRYRKKNTYRIRKSYR
jgi:hypothetical protein